MNEAPTPLFSDRERHAASFTGAGGEYFRIWIVNVALTIVTFGIYSAWAKVRRETYFARHTRLAGASFDYHGDPVAILKGRLIALVFMVLYLASGFLGPEITVAVVVLIAALVPWLFTASLRFQLRNTSYRGIRFRFHGETREAYRIFVGFGLLTLVTFGMAAPLLYHRLKTFQHGHVAFGQSRFGFSVGVWEVYRVFIVAWLIGIAVAFMILMVGAGAAFLSAITGRVDEAGELLIAVGLMLSFVVYILAIVALQALFRVRMRNLCWNQTSLGEHRLRSDLAFGRYFVIQLTNLLATVATLGFFRPFAQVRVARYVVEASAVVVAGSLDAFVAGLPDGVGAFGEEAAGLFDFDVAF